MFDFTVSDGPGRKEGIEGWNLQETEIRISVNELRDTLIE